MLQNQKDNTSLKFPRNCPVCLGDLTTATLFISLRQKKKKIFFTHPIHGEAASLPNMRMLMYFLPLQPVFSESVLSL